jgi:hypothetical protein
MSAPRSGFVCTGPNVAPRVGIGPATPFDHAIPCNTVNQLTGEPQSVEHVAGMPRAARAESPA